jgi:hypothetical protein
MAKFAVVETDGTIGEERYDTIEKAIEVATVDVTDSPDSEVEIVQIIKKVVSSLKVDVEDVV